MGQAVCAFGIDVMHQGETRGFDRVSGSANEMSQPRQRRLLTHAVVAVPCLLIGAVFLGLLPWRSVNCSHHDVDIHSGRLRFTQYLFWVPVQERIEDSSLTRALRPDDLAGTGPSWRRAMTLSPGHHSPHYVFHSAIHQIQELERLWRLADFSPEARRASAKRVLQLWQQHGEDSEAGEYLSAVSKRALAAR